MTNPNIRLWAMMVLVATVMGAAPTTGPGDQTEFAAFGLEIQTPRGWERVPEGGINRAVRWSFKNGAGEVNALLNVEVEPQRDRTLRAFVRSLASSTGGTASDDTLKVGGLPAMRLKGGRVGGMFSSALVVNTNGQFYILNGVARELAALPEAQLELLSRSIKFVPIRSPSEAPYFRPDPANVSNDLSIQVLTTMRPAPPQQGAGPADPPMMATTNFQTQRMEFCASVDVVSNPIRRSLQALADDMGKQINVSWSPVGDDSRRLLSSPVGMPNTTAKARYGLIAFTDDSAVLVTFTFGPELTGAQTQIYNRLAEEMLKSVKRTANR